MTCRGTMPAWLMTLIVSIWFGAAGRAATVSSLFARGYDVIPMPQQVVLKGGDFEFGSGWRLELGSGVKADDVAVESLKDGLSSRYGATLETAGRGRAPGKVVSLEIQPGSVEIGQATDQNKPALEEQAYKLELGSEEIRITANAPTGLFYGVETLVQLVKPAEGKLWLPQAEVTDWPDLEQRNIFWDDAHHLERMDVPKRVLRQAAFYKINGIVILLDGHFDYKSAPALVEPYALSPAQLQELTNYGLKYHVQLIPYLNAPAHIVFMLKHPEYAGLRVFPDSNYELCTTNPDSYKLLDGMYQNLLDANKGVKYFFLANDEAYYVGMADNDQCHSKKRAEELGSRGKLLAEFVTKTAGYLHDRGRTVMFWACCTTPLELSDIPSLPPYLMNGEGIESEFDRALQAHGIRQMIYASIQGVEPYFPNDYLSAPSGLLNPTEMQDRDRIDQVFNNISLGLSDAGDSMRKQTNLMGVIVCGWGDEGLHPETFWLGYITATGWGWHPGSPSPDEAASSFYHVFYGPGAVDMERVYQLMSTQAEFWSSSWDRGPSTARKPIFGNSDQVYKVRRPAHDQTLPLPPVPQGEYLRLPFDWSLENAKRVKMAQDNMPANAELLGLLHANLHSVQFQRYNLQVFLSIAGLCRQNLQMLTEMEALDGALKAAQAAAAHVEYAQAVASLDRALDIAQHIRYQRNLALDEAVDTWYKSWYPRVAEANGRKFLNEVDDVKDHLPMRTVDMSYLVNREMILPMGEWFEQVENARNQYAQAHNLPARTDKLDWKDAQTGGPNPRPFHVHD
jgi:hexosaminidase